MPYEMTVGLDVVDDGTYARYRREMRPLLAAAGGEFRYDFVVARTLEADQDVEINRAFILRFPDRAAKDRFFADPRYLEIRARLFEPAVRTRVTLAEYVTDATARPPSR